MKFAQILALTALASMSAEALKLQTATGAGAMASTHNNSAMGGEVALGQLASQVAGEASIAVDAEVGADSETIDCSTDLFWCGDM